VDAAGRRCVALGKQEMARRLLGSLQVDASKARKVLGWKPPVSLDEGLRRAAAPLLVRGR
jgi:nucleoside-diphosphate-sugar epimerase